MMIIFNKEETKQVLKKDLRKKKLKSISPN